MVAWWHVLPDDERQQWTVDPFVAVGPLAFDMSPGEVSNALSDVTSESQRHMRHRSAGNVVDIVERGEYKSLGLKLYYRDERLAGVG